MSDLVLIIGGTSGIGLETANYLFDKGCDLTIFGEPERRIKEIIKGVLENENLENIPDIAFKKNNQIVCTKHDEYDN